MTAPLLTYGGRGKSDDVVHVKLETLYETRMLLQGSSGAGKTQACFQLLEETHGRVQQIVLDKEGEFAKLREKFDYLIIGGEGEQRIPMRKGALELQLTRVLELEISAIYDLSDLLPDQQRHVVARLARAMAHLPQRSGLWERMRLLLIDEAQWFAPQQGKAESLEPLIELASLGRKRGFCPVAAGTRVAMMAKSFTELLENKLIGRAGTNDSKRAAEELEFDKHGRKELRSLPVGHFFAYGPAIALDPMLVQTPKELPVLPRRRGEHRAPTPATSAKVQRALEKFAGLEEEAEQKERTLEELEQQLAGARRQIVQLQRGAPSIDREMLEREKRTAAEKALLGAERAELQRRERVRQQIERAMRHARDGIQLLEPLAVELGQGAAAAVLAGDVDIRDVLKSGAVSAPASARRSREMENGAASARVTRAPAKVPAVKWDDRELASDGVVTPKQRELLGTLRSFEKIGVAAVPRPNLAAFVGYSATTKAFKNNLALLRTGGLVDYSGDGIVLTDQGRKHAPDDGIDLLSVMDLHDAWRRRLAPADWRLLEPLLSAHPEGIPRDELAAAVGYATTTKAFKNGLSKLRTLGAIDYRGGEVVATSMLFPEGLR